MLHDRCNTLFVHSHIVIGLLVGCGVQCTVIPHLTLSTCSSDPPAVWTQYGRVVREKAPTHERGGAAGTDEALTVPVSIIERYELHSTEPCDWMSAAAAFLREELSEAVGTIWPVIT